MEEFSLRLTSQLCEIEKKLISLTDQQSKTEKIIYETILPSIQALCGAAAQPSKKKQHVQDELNKVSKEIKDVMKGHKQLRDKQNHILSAVRTLTSFDDDSN
jgi:predicted  nucleic acid-binding Zn-ribbon protein